MKLLVLKPLQLNSSTISFTISTLVGPQTPVTSAPYSLAIWTPNVPTPPEAPMIRTF